MTYVLNSLEITSWAAGAAPVSLTSLRLPTPCSPYFFIIVLLMSPDLQPEGVRRA
jgi:hypothetical protein